MNLNKVKGLVGQSAWTNDTQARIEHAAAFRATVLVAGPSGTGKELVARGLHQRGPRRDGPFIPVNCAAVPHTLFDSQMFGHTRGAFTGADYESLGAFRAAEGGTLFLDEIGELDLDLQAKLLRVLQDREVKPVGSQTSVRVDVRIVAATNRDLKQEVAAGRFRLDLYYRLNVIQIPTLALKDRVEDIAPLARHMLDKACVENGLPAKRLTNEAIRLLERNAWPGNVRELQNVMERVALCSFDTTVTADAVAPHLGDETPASASSRETSNDSPSSSLRDDDEIAADEGAGRSSDDGPTAGWKSLEEVEAHHIDRTLQHAKFNKTAAARLLGIDRKRLARKITKYELLATA